MPIKTTLSTETANAMAEAVGNLLRGGSVCVYAGKRPLTCGGQSLSELLFESSLAGAEFTTSSGGTVMITNIAVTDASNEGKATWYRAMSEEHVPVLDGYVGTENANCILDTVDVKTGARVTIKGFSFTVPTN